MLKKLEICAGCSYSELKILYDFGRVPLAGYFPKPGEENEKNLMNMVLVECVNCGLVQVDPIVEDSYLFSDYRYRSSFSMKEHFEELAHWIREKNFRPSARILEIGSNDGTLLNELISQGFEPIGVDPAKNIITLSRARGHNVIEGHFSTDLVYKNSLLENFDILLSCNSFAHIENIQDVARAVSLSLVEGGVFIVEVQSWEELIKKGAFDFVYHEHKYYYDIDSIRNLMRRHGLELVEHEKIEIHGGSWRLLFVKQGTELTIDKSKFRYQELEGEFEKAIATFRENIDGIRKAIDNIKKEGGKIIGFGASGRANMLMAYLGINEKIDWIFDESPERIGRNMGFTGIKIRSMEELQEDEYTHCLVLAWNFFDSIRSKWPHRGKVLLRPLPILEFVQT